MKKFLLVVIGWLLAGEYTYLGGANWYVNDNSTTNDVWCTAVGDNATGDGSTGLPYATVRYVIDSKVLGPGDTVFVETGTYIHASESEDILITGDDDGDATGCVVFLASPNGVTIDGYDKGFDIRDASYVIIDGFTIDSTLSQGIRIGCPASGCVNGDCQYDTIRNCTISNWSLQAGNVGPGIHIAGTSPTGQCEYMGIYDNILAGIDSCEYGIYVTGNGSGASSSRYIEIYDNDVSGCTHRGICLYDYVEYTDVYRNRIHNIDSCGIYIHDEMVEVHIYNNMIYDFNVFGIYVVLSGEDSTEIYYNSFYGLGTCFYDGSVMSKDNSVILKNNSLYTTGGSSYCIQLPAFGDIPSDYNNLYAPNYKVGKRGISEYDTLEAWWVTGLDTHSVDWSPQYVSATDLHIDNITSANIAMATPIPGYPTDYDGDTRDVVHPDIGCDEWPGGSGSDEINVDAEKCFLDVYPTINKNGIKLLLNFGLENESYVSIKLYDISGSLHLTLLSKNLVPGKHSIKPDLKGVPSGIYFICMETDKFKGVRKIILVK